MKVKIILTIFIFLIAVISTYHAVGFVITPKTVQIGLGAISGDCGGPNGIPDGFVDLFDYGNLSRSFGLTQGQAGFNAACDFYVDSHNIIDLLDYGILAQNFGRSSASNTPTPTPGNTSSAYPIGWYTFLYTTANLAAVQSDGANTVVAWPSYDSVSGVRSFLDTAQSRGIKVILSVREMNDAAIQTMSVFANHQALTGWYVADEPEEFSYNAHACDIVRSFSVREPCFVAHYNPGSFDQFTSITDVPMIDYYPGLNKNLSSTPFSSGITYIDRWVSAIAWGKAHNQPVYVIPQGFTANREMSEAEYRFHALSGIAAGADGVIFWHTDPQDDPQHQWTTTPSEEATIARVIKFVSQTELGAAMKASESFDSAHYRGVNDDRITVSGATTVAFGSTGGQLMYRYGITGSKHVILAVSKSSGTLSSVRFFANGITGSSATVIGENRTLPISNNGFSDNFAPYAVHAYSF